VNETCTAGAGTLLLEFGLLSRLLGDPVYEGFARRAINQLWSLRSNVTGLFGVFLFFSMLFISLVHRMHEKYSIDNNNNNNAVKMLMFMVLYKRKQKLTMITKI